ncbi:MAG: SMC-Scp complex subunit ScpB [Oscillospiraceae bacterium]|nr:SMC-Scp complex subunit ScpB [Oscillospiraceae bacterium]
MIDLKSAIEAVLFAAGDPFPTARLSLILGQPEEDVELAVSELAESYEKDQRGFRLLRLGDKLQICSAPEYAPIIIKALEQRKPPMLSQPALETLAIVAYFQPVTRAYVDQVRGVDSSYTVGMLTERGLIESCGRLDVPGRPALFRTTDLFLRTMGIQKLEDLPPLPDMTQSDGVEKLQRAIDDLQNAQNGQLVMEGIDN